jgi:hypothetical protein
MRKKQTDENLRRGLVIKGRFRIASHEKYFVLMSLSEDFKTAYGLFINSNPHPLAQKNQTIKETQVEIKPGIYNFLQKPTPSFVDCYNFYKTPFNNLYEALVESPSKMCGHLSSQHLEEILRAVRLNPSFTINEKINLTGEFKLPPNLPF